MNKNSREIFRSKFNQIAGSNFSEVSRKANSIFKQIKSKSKRRPYVRSAYFNKDKVFISQFLSHTFEKNWRDATRRLKLFECAIDLIKNNHTNPVSKDDSNDTQFILHRFSGLTKQRELFYVQIKENKKTGEKIFLSAFLG
ncbi:MAG TPA: hypothetical protein VJB58_01220 [Candidatus Paceibacterota bacterium]